MEYWIARDDTGQLWAFEHKPSNDRGLFVPDPILQGNNFEIPHWMFPEVTHKNSPQKIKIELTNSYEK